MTNNMPESQAERFRQAARELETDNDEKRFDRLLGKLAKAKKPKEKKKPVKRDWFQAAIS